MTNDYITYDEYAYLMNRIAYWLTANKKSFKTRDIYGYNGKALTKQEVLDKIKANGTNYKSDGFLAEYCECAIYDNKNLGFLPNYVTGSNGVKYYTNTFVDMANRVSAYEVLHGRSPNIVYIQGVKENNTTSKTVDKTLQAFVNAFGKVTDFDSALSKVKGRRYLKYYNSMYNTAQTLQRMVNRQGTNCTDASQYFYRIALALNYDVQFVHVMCSSGTGHVRLRLKHPKNTGGAWILRDPASVLNGGSIISNWCTTGSRIIAYNPSWIFSDLYQ